MPTREWRCPKCREVLGDVSPAGTELRIRRQGTVVELGRHGAIIRCPCGGVSGFTDGRVIVRVGRVLNSRR